MSKMGPRTPSCSVYLCSKKYVLDQCFVSWTSVSRSQRAKKAWAPQFRSISLIKKYHIIPASCFESSTSITLDFILPFFREHRITQLIDYCFLRTQISLVYCSYFSLLWIVSIISVLNNTIKLELIAMIKLPLLECFNKLKIKTQK